MNYANKDRRKTVEIKFGNLDYFIILLQYNIRKEAGCHLFLRMKRSGHKKKTTQSLRGLSEIKKFNLKKKKMKNKFFTYSLKGFQENFRGNSPRG